MHHFVFSSLRFSFHDRCLPGCRSPTVTLCAITNKWWSSVVTSSHHPMNQSHILLMQESNLDSVGLCRRKKPSLICMLKIKLVESMWFENSTTHGIFSKSLAALSKTWGSFHAQCAAPQMVFLDDFFCDSAGCKCISIVSSVENTCIRAKTKCPALLFPLKKVVLW